MRGRLALLLKSPELPKQGIRARPREGSGLLAACTRCETKRESKFGSRGRVSGSEKEPMATIDVRDLRREDFAEENSRIDLGALGRLGAGRVGESSRVRGVYLRVRNET